MARRPPGTPEPEQPGHGHAYAPTAWGVPPAYPLPRTELASRIAGVESEPAGPVGGHHPAGTPDTLMHADVVLVEVSADRVQVQQCLPIYAGTGTGAAPIPAKSPGHWAQLYAAGRS